MSARVTLRRGFAYNIDRDGLDEALAPLLDRLDLEPDDVLTVHVGVRHVSVKVVARNGLGNVVPGATTTLRFPVVPS